MASNQYAAQKCNLPLAAIVQTKKLFTERYLRDEYLG